MRAVLMLVALAACADDGRPVPPDAPDPIHGIVSCNRTETGFCEAACAVAVDPERISCPIAGMPGQSCGDTTVFMGQRGCCSPEYFDDPSKPTSDDTLVFLDCE